jgi:putative PIN family toxin of toxin-antitoxin system
LTAVLKYPKFSLVPDEIQSIVEEEILPYFEVVEIGKGVKGVCRDPEDHKFIACAVCGSADFLVTGDKDLLDLKPSKAVRIIRPSDFLKIFE